MSKVVDITGASSKEARLKRIIASLEEIKDTLVDVIEHMKQKMRAVTNWIF